MKTHQFLQFDDFKFIENENENHFHLIRPNLKFPLPACQVFFSKYLRERGGQSMWLHQRGTAFAAWCRTWIRGLFQGFGITRIEGVLNICASQRPHLNLVVQMSRLREDASCPQRLRAACFHAVAGVEKSGLINICFRKQKTGRRSFHSLNDLLEPGFDRGCRSR